MVSRRGVVFLVGGGPGDPGLVTRRGEEVLASAECVVFDGLVSEAVLALASATAERIYAGKKRSTAGEPLTQGQINDLLVDRARRGLRVVRLKGGDPFVFGRGAEELRVLADAGIRFEVVPGVTAATSVPAYAGIPLTARGMTSTVALVTGHEADGKLSTDIDWKGVAAAGTAVLFMALSNIEPCVGNLIAAGRAADTPAAAIYWGTTGAQRTVEATLEELPAACRRASLKPPVLIVVGDVVSLREQMAWFEDRPLFGKRVLITREGEKARMLARSVSELGGEPVLMPVTRTERCGDPQLIDAAIERLRTGALEWVVFASANAVDYWWQVMGEQGGDARWFAGLKVAAVGGKTAAALEGHGIRADLIPARGNAEQLARAVRDASDGNARALVPRSATGRPELIEGLAQVLDEVVAVDVYRTVSVDAGDPVLEGPLRKLRSGAIEIALVFAPSQVAALVEILGDPVELNRVALVATIGSTTAGALAAAGRKADVVASRPDADVLLAEVIETLNEGE